MQVRALEMTLNGPGSQRACDKYRYVGKCLRTSLLHLDEKPAPRAIAPKACCRLAIPVSE